MPFSPDASHCLPKLLLLQPGEHVRPGSQGDAGQDGGPGRARGAARGVRQPPHRHRRAGLAPFHGHVFRLHRRRTSENRRFAVLRRGVHLPLLVPAHEALLETPRTAETAPGRPYYAVAQHRATHFREPRARARARARGAPGGNDLVVDAERQQQQPPRRWLGHGVGCGGGGRRGGRQRGGASGGDCRPRPQPQPQPYVRPVHAAVHAAGGRIPRGAATHPHRPRELLDPVQPPRVGVGDELRVAPVQVAIVEPLPPRVRPSPLAHRGGRGAGVAHVPCPRCRCRCRDRG